MIFSAHSCRCGRSTTGTQRCKHCDCDDACRYRDELRETADLVGRRGSALDDYTIAWQSAGRTADPWWGPPVEDVIRELAAAGRASAVVVCSAGFVADHLEILYDLDIEATAIAEEAGIAFARTEMPNDDPAFLDVLAQVVREHLAEEPAAMSGATRVVVVGGGLAGLAAAYRLAGGTRRSTSPSSRRPIGRAASSAPIEVGGVACEAGPIRSSPASRGRWSCAPSSASASDLVVARRVGRVRVDRAALVPFPRGRAVRHPADLGERAAVARPVARRQAPSRSRTCVRAAGGRTSGRDARSAPAPAPRRRGDRHGRGPAPGRDLRRRPRPAVRAGDVPRAAAWERTQGSLIRGCAGGARAAARRDRPRRCSCSRKGGVDRLTDALARRGRSLRTAGPVTRLRRSGIARGRCSRRPRRTGRRRRGRGAGDSRRTSPGGPAERGRPDAAAGSRASRTARPASSRGLRRRDRGVAAGGHRIRRRRAVAGADDRLHVVSAKWPDPAFGRARWSGASSGGVGRRGRARPADDELVARVRPTSGRGARAPGRGPSRRRSSVAASMPQYEVGHLDRVAAIRRSLPAGLFVTGSAYGGVGIADCVRAAGETAERVLAHLDRETNEEEHGAMSDTHRSDRHC